MNRKLTVNVVASVLHKKFPLGHFRYPLDWVARCYEVASAMVEAKLVKGHAVYGHWLGAVDDDSPFAGKPVIHHGWVLGQDGLVVDPTRWVFEAVKPYIFVGYPPAADDFDPAAWPYDEGGDQLRRAMRGPCPVVTPDDETVELQLTSKAARTSVMDLVGRAGWVSPSSRRAVRDGSPLKLSKAQLVWLGNAPYDDFQGHAPAVYQAFKRLKRLAIIPMDHIERARREAGVKL